MTWLPEWVVLEGLAILGATCGAVGSLALLRRQNLLADTLAHAALPGICLAYLITGEKDLPLLLLGAAVSGTLGVWLILAIVQTSRLKQDAALGIVLSTFFALGLLLLTYLQNFPAGNQAGLNTFIYGQVAYLRGDHVRWMLGVGVIVLFLIALLYKEFKLVCFDPEYAQTLGLRRRLLEFLLAMLLVLTVLISLRSVGVVLTVGLLTAPAAAARQWTNRLSAMIVLAAGIGVVCSWIGALWSQNVPLTPAGPAIVLTASVFMLGSLLLAPRRGVLAEWLRQLAHRRKVRLENLLSDFYRLGEIRHVWDRPWSVADLAAVRGLTPDAVRRTLNDLEDAGLAVESDGGWQLTQQGLDEAARIVRMHRLWELYLSRRLDLAADHTHRDAEAMEHVLTPELVAELEAALEHPETDPQGKPIPRGRPLAENHERN
ncbi:MAG: metal ABC transporter permease [Gemmatales bacterium]|nr:metal ABC transporter permease [Gemmatales bacterium]MDW8386985.1 iron chelate uptake ABC transporter family permease subunit [Gemmatales bacterium]